MAATVRDRIIKILVEEIETVSDADFEIIAQMLVKQLTGVQQQELGVNIEGKTVGYTVDGRSPDSRIAHECSTQKNYFTDKKYSKINKDIKHAIDSTPGKLTDIYLFASKKEPPSFRTGFLAFINENYPDYHIHIYAARSIADLIFEAFVSDTQSKDFYTSIFPKFALETSIYSYYGIPPKHSGNYYSNDKALIAIQEHFKTNSICCLSGLSGSGKTEIAIEYAEISKEEGYNLLWITGEGWQENASLQSITRLQAENAINVAGIFNSIKTVLIIDNLNRICSRENFSELKEGFRSGGKILVTTQLTDQADIYLPIPKLTEDCACRILGEQKSALTDTARLFIQKCLFSPLILATVRNMTVSFSLQKEDLYNEVMQQTEILEDKTGKEIIKRILERLNEKSLISLKKIANSGISTFDANFLKYYISNISFVNLYRASLINTTSVPGMVCVHDLICEALRDNGNANSDLCTVLEEYWKQNKGMTTAAVLRQIYCCRHVLFNLHITQPENHWVAYALLQIAGKKERSVYKEYHDKPFTSDMDIASLALLIDAREQYSYEDNFNDDEDCCNYCKHCADEYLEALKNFSYDNTMQTTLLHHRGKALKRCKDYGGAVRCFQKVLKRDPEYFPSYIQLASIGTKGTRDYKDIGEEALKQLLDYWLVDKKDVSLRVMLQGIAIIRSYNSLKYSLDKDKSVVKRLGEIIAMSAWEGFGQVYEAFAAFTTVFGYHHPESVISLVKTAPQLLTVTHESVEKKQWFNVCDALSNLINSANEAGDRALSVMAKQATIRFTESIVPLLGKWYDYALRAVAKAFIVAGKPQQALEVINNNSAGISMSHWSLYRKAQAEMMLNLPVAVETASLALEDLQKDKKNKDIQIANYYVLLADCYEAAGNIQRRLEFLAKAADSCNDEKYLKDIQGKIERIKEM